MSKTKEWYIYEMYDILSPTGMPYIGSTCDMRRRSIQHKSRKKLSTVPTLVPILGPFSDRWEAYRIENDLREKNGWLREGAVGGMAGNRETHAIGGSIGGSISAQMERTCPHCGKVGRSSGMFRWHFDRCKNKS